MRNICKDWSLFDSNFHTLFSWPISYFAFSLYNPYMPQQKPKNRHFKSVSALRGNTHSMSKRSNSQDSSPAKGILGAAFFGSSIVPGNPKKAKGVFKIIDTSTTLKGKTEYIGENESTSRLKYFNRKMVVQSNDIFSKVLTLYAKKLQYLLTEDTSNTKDEQNRQMGSRRVWDDDSLYLLIQMSILRGVNRTQKQSRLTSY